MSEWFECKVKYERTMQDGALKKVCEPYLVEALNFTEAERRIIEEVSPYISGEFEVTNITRARFAEIFETLEDSADKWYKARLASCDLTSFFVDESRCCDSLICFCSIACSS